MPMTMTKSALFGLCLFVYVISAIMATHKGRVDGKAVSAAVKARLS